MVLFENVKKTYPGGVGKKSVEALRGISFSLERGEVVAYVGPNGAGKTTSLNILLGLLSPTSGRVLVDERPPQHPAARRSIGYLPERPLFYEQLTAVEFLHLCGRLSSMGNAEIASKGKQLLEKLGLADAAGRKLRHFSRGMLQRLGLVQALIHDPQLLVLDEPMGGLDPLGRQLVREIIAEAKAAGKTVLFSSHILSDAELVADRVAVIADGRLLKLAPLEELRRSGEGDCEVTFASSEEIPLSHISQEWPQGKMVGDLWVVKIPENHLQQLLAKAVDMKTQVVQIQAPTTPLEDTLVGLMKSAQEKGGGE